MIIDLHKIIGPYERRARLYPSLLCLFPLILGISVLFPSLYAKLSGLAALAVSLGVLQLLVHITRDGGKGLEIKLFKEWGGMPSVAIFRFSDENIPGPAKYRYHNMISAETGIAPPTEEFEATSPKEAEDIYLSWSDYLRGKTRDRNKYPMVFEENINYGFRRNLLGVKAFCILSGILSLVMIGISSYKYGSYTELTVGISLVITLYIFVFIFIVNKNWVKTAAYAYAKQLVESINA